MLPDIAHAPRIVSNYEAIIPDNLKKVASHIAMCIALMLCECYVCRILVSTLSQEVRSPFYQNYAANYR